jgi:NCS1 family nucleobase:cation symporter-1
VDGAAYEPFLFLIGAVFVPLAATFVVDYLLRRRSGYDVSGTAPTRWLPLLPWLAGFAAYQLTAPTVLSSWSGWEEFWRNAQDALGVSPTNGFSASLVAFAVAAVLAAVTRFAGRLWSGTSRS